MAADTRMSTGFSIMTRDCKKIVELCAPRGPFAAARCLPKGLRASGRCPPRRCAAPPRRRIQAARLRPATPQRARLPRRRGARDPRRPQRFFAPRLGLLARAPALTQAAPPARSSDRCVVGSPGFLADAVTLQKHLRARQVMYQHNHGAPMSCPAMAQARRKACARAPPCCAADARPRTC